MVTATAVLLMSAQCGLAAEPIWKTDPFPRIGGMNIGGPWEDPAYRERLSKRRLVIISPWRGWKKRDTITGETLTAVDVVRDIRRRAAANGNPDILIGNYTVYNESPDTPGGAKDDRYQKLSSETGPGYPRNNDWWARDANGSAVGTWPETWNTNLTQYVKPDAQGRRWVDWATQRDYEERYMDLYDIWYVDNWFYRPRTSPDWDGDGRNDDRDDPDVQRIYRESYVRILENIRRLHPTAIIMGNVDGNVGQNRGMLTEREYNGKLEAFYEGMLGRPFSNENNIGWRDGSMKQYQTTLAGTKSGLLLVSVAGDPKDYKFMRYALTSTLMDDGYFNFRNSAIGYKDAYWFDEYDADLGRAVDPPQFKAWKQGVYRRQFDNGIALVNPKGNGRQRIELEAAYQKLRGTQDPAYNDGSTVTSVTLDERDGIILLSTEERPQAPKPPTLE